jgi:hypothetical protein
MKTKWTTEKPTEPGWYYVYYNHKGWPPKIEIFEVESTGYPKPYDLCIGKGQNGEMCIKDTDAYTHWSKIELPEPPK